MSGLRVDLGFQLCFLGLLFAKIIFLSLYSGFFLGFFLGGGGGCFWFFIGPFGFLGGFFLFCVWCWGFEVWMCGIYIKIFF